MSASRSQTGVTVRHHGGKIVGVFRTVDTTLAPQLGHRENGFEDSSQCGCKHCTARRATHDKAPRTLAQINAAHRAAHATK
jgi:hypothetical protein